MSSKLAASIKARLLNLARSQRSDYNRLLLRYVQERFLARLSASSHRDRLVLKGGLFLYAHCGEAARYRTDPSGTVRRKVREERRQDVLALLPREPSAAGSRFWTNHARQLHAHDVDYLDYH